MKPKPRSAFHIFKVPVAILFPLFQPQLNQTMMATAAEPVAHRKAAATVGGGPESILQRHLRVASERSRLVGLLPGKPPSDIGRMLSEEHARA